MIRLGMPFDLESVLSSSPPGFGLNLDISSSFLRRPDEQSAERREHYQFGKKAKWQRSDTRVNDETDVSGLEESDSEVLQRQSPRLNAENLRRIAIWETHYDCDQRILDFSEDEEPPVRLSRKVSFADHLESVIIIEESPDDPPPVLHHRNQIDEVVSSGAVMGDPQLALNFTQPAADYVTFRNAVETQFVSLANVILNNLRVSGTVRVKNLAYEKSVVVRYSFDGWMTHSELPAVYQVDDDERFDTFTFVIDCPSNPQPGSKLQFAVRYIAAGVEYWDSNRGEDYEVLYISGNSAADQQLQNPVVSRQRDYVWSEYSGWSDIDVTCPYW